MRYAGHRPESRGQLLPRNGLPAGRSGKRNPAEKNAGLLHTSGRADAGGLRPPSAGGTRAADEPDSPTDVTRPCCRPCAPVWAYSAIGGSSPPSQVKPIVGALCGDARLSPFGHNMRCPCTVLGSKKEQDKGGWSQAPSRRSPRPAVLGVFCHCPRGGRIADLSRSEWSKLKKKQITKGIWTVTPQVYIHETEACI